MQRKVLTLVALSIMTMGFAQNYNFLGEYTADGTPKYLVEPDEVSYVFLQLINDALPENYPVPVYNPQYITSGYDTNIVLEDNADVWVTFVSEGAGYRNVLGFYTYDVNEPSPTAPSPEDITIVFPNVSALGSGGGLKKGDKVKIGRFSAGTGIGWVLLANGWKGSVTSGLWQLFSTADYNPESDENLRYHNVLLNDPHNECVILGFEDIRRDYASCDQDFNDALFYITASSYSAMKTTNYNTITEHSYVTSSNDGGLESNGDLASLIAKRNFDRSKTNSFKNSKKKQKQYSKKTYKSLGAKSGQLDTYFPASGMFGTETTYVSSPEDLLNITNADNIFSIDYYEGQDRVSAALATETRGSVYDHTKTICDRLNNAQLVDVRTVTLQGHELVYSELLRANGVMEYALTFSVKEEGGSKRLFSLWNLDDYPEGDYLNFQVWGNSMGQVTTLVNHIMNTLSESGKLEIHKSEDILPTVFIKKGYYKQGKLYLSIVNKVKATWLNIDGNYKTTEYEDEKNLNNTITLSGAYEEEVIIDTGYLFDIGISVLAENSYQYDAMYLADGPWGADFNTDVDAIAQFEITGHQESKVADAYAIERSMTAKGQVKETINVFRNVLAGDLWFASTDYNYLQFEVQNDLPVEVSLVTNATDDWNERLRYTIKPNPEAVTASIAFSDFKDNGGKFVDFTKIKTIVFSIQGDYQNYNQFHLKIQNMAFAENTSDELADVEEVEEEIVAAETEESIGVEEIKQNIQLMHYPNPCTEYTIITLPLATEQLAVTLTNVNGQNIYQQIVKTQSSQHTIRIDMPNLPTGLYCYTLFDNQNGKIYQGKLIKN